jgi:hypothetical protein
LAYKTISLIHTIHSGHNKITTKKNGSVWVLLNEIIHTNSRAFFTGWGSSPSGKSMVFLENFNILGKLHDLKKKFHRVSRP